MKKKNKDKREFSMLSNIVYSFRDVVKICPAVLVVDTVLLILGVVTSVAVTYQSKLILDALDGRNDTMTALIMIAVIVGAFLLLALLRSLASHISQYLVNLYWDKCLRPITTLLCRTDYEKLESPEYKNIFTRYQSNKASQPYLETHSTLEFLQSIASAVIFGALVSTLHPLIIAGLVVLAVFHYLARHFHTGKKHEYEVMLMNNDRRFGYVTDIAGDFENAKEVRLYEMPSWIDEVTEDCIRTHRRLHSAIQWGAFKTGLVHNLLSLLRDGFAYVYLILLFAKGEMTPGNFVLFFTAITTLSSTITGLTDKFNNIRESNLRVSDVRRAENVLSAHNHGIGAPLPISPPRIEFRNVSYRYLNADHDTLKSISFTMEKGERVALVGINGAGKTTLVKLLCGLYQPTEGEILVDGKPISDYNIEEYYSLFSAVFQDISIMPYSVAENVAATLDAEKIDRERVLDALSQAGLSEKIASLEHGIDALFDKEVNENAIDLSGGEKQKLALARAIYLARPILVLDEPTAALDPIAESAMYERFDDISGKATSLFISHRLASTRFCDRIYHMENGEIIESGDHHSLLAANGKYAEMFRVQSAYYTEEAENDEE